LKSTEKTTKTTELQQYKGHKSAKCLPLECDDTTAILTMIIDKSTARMGRPCQYSNDKRGLEEFVQNTIEYFEYVNTVNSNPDLDKKLIPDIESWAVYLGITRNTILNYEQRGGNWLDVIQFYKNAIASVKKQLALTFKVPPMIMAFDFTNNHGYCNTNEFKLTTEVKTPDTDTNRLERELVERGLVWDEERKEFVPVEEV